MVSQWLLCLAVLGQTPAAQPAQEAPRPGQAAPAPPLVGPPAPARVAPARPAPPPVRAQVVPARRVPTSAPANANRVALPQRIRGTATQPGRRGAPRGRPPARVLPDLQLSGAEVTFEIVGTKLIIRGVKSDLDQLESFISEIRDDLPRRQTRLVKLLNTRADEVGPMVAEIFNQLVPEGAGPEAQVIVMPVPNSNSLLVATTDENFEHVLTVIRSIDEQTVVAPDDTSMEWIELVHVPATEAKVLLLRLLKLPAAAGGAAAGAEERIKVETYPTFKKLLVTGTPADLDRVKELVEKYIDLPPVEGGGTIELKMIKLKNTNAEDMVAILEEIIMAGQSTADAANAGAATMQESLREHIRRLRLVTTVDGLDKGLELDLQTPIRLVADPQASGTNSILVGSTHENIEAMTEIIALLDSVPLAPAVSVKVFMLKHADAEDVVALLTELFDQGKALPLRPGQREAELTSATPPTPEGEALVRQIGLSADPRTNAVIVSGAEATIALAETIIEQLDGEGVGLKHPLRLIAVENASASALVDTIQELFDQRMQTTETLNVGPGTVAKEEVFVAADARSNTIIISANDENYAEVVKLVRQLDSARDIMGEIRIITLENMQASDLADKITQMWQDRLSALSEAGPGDTRSLPVIFADIRSNALVIASTQGDYKAIKALIDKLEAQPLSPIADIRVITLRNNDASQVGPMLATLFDERMQQRLAAGQEEMPSDRVAIQADPGTNTILVASSKENYDLIMKLIKPLDEVPTLRGQIKTFMLENANAEQMAQTLDELFAQGGIVTETPVLDTQSPVVEARTQVTIVPDVRANAVIVSATKEYLALVETLIDELDAIGVPRIYENMRFIKVEYADVLRLKAMMDELFTQTGGGTQNVSISTTIIADDRTNTLVLWGSRDGVSRAEEFVKRIDVEETAETASFVVYPLEHTSAQKMAPVLQDLFDNRLQGAGGAGGANERTPINVFPDEGTNTLIVSASRADHVTFKELLADVDKPSKLTTQLTFIPLKNADAESVADTLQELIDERLRAQGGGAGGGAGGGGTGISIAAEPRTNSLIVWATPSDLVQVQELVTKLDNLIPARTVALKLFKLRNSLAEDLANMLVNHLQVAGTGETSVTTADEGGGGGGSETSVVIIELPVLNLETGEMEIRKLLRQDITITPDAASNTLMVSAPPESIDMLESLIRTLDEIKPLTSEIEVFSLYNSNAEEMQRMLEQLFQVGEFRPTDDEANRTLFLAGGEGGGLALAGGLGGEGIITGKDEIAFSVDLRTNSIIAAGSRAHLELVARMIEQLDSVEIEERISKVVEVKYNTAPLIADAVSAFIDAEVALYDSLGENVAVQRQIEREVTVVAQEETNRLLLSVSPRYESQVMDMIRQLDQPPPMVTVEVLIAEVTIDDSLELGMEFALQDLLFSERATVNANGIVQGGNFDFVGGTDIGASGSAALGGFSFTVNGEDFSFLLRTLKTEGRLEVLSRPSVKVQDGKTANINIGQEVPFVRNVQVSDTGSVQSQVEYQPIGIILEVTPHINADGFVHLQIAPEVSSITDSSVTITEGFTAPIFSTTTVETEVTIRDGETVVIGGLISQQKDERENKVPILGDLPFIGPLFRATSTSSSRRELLIIITPHVERTVDDTREHAENEITKQTPNIDKFLRQDPVFHRLQRKPGDQLRGVPIELGPQNGNGAGRMSWPRGTLPPTSRPTRPTGNDTYAPRPNVYGPPRPVSIGIGPDGAPLSMKPGMVGPENYEQYLKQRR